MADFITHFSIIEDPRIERCKKHKLLDILFLTVSAVLSGAQGWEDIEEFGHSKLEWLKRFIELPNGIPRHDTIARVMGRLEPNALQQCFFQWMSDVVSAIDGDVIAIDGKSVRRSFDKASRKNALHLVSAWSCAGGVALGQVATDKKSNEITAIPRLLELLEIKKCIITIDAIGCQKAIASEIVKKKADYVLGVKKNQPTLHDDCAQYFENHLLKQAEPSSKTGVFETIDKAHGRLEIRRCWQSTELKWLPSTKEWPGARSVLRVECERQTDSGVSCEVRYFISSLPLNPEKALSTVRQHWFVENQLHWVLDVTFGEDDSRIRRGDAAENMAVLRRLALNICKRYANGDSNPKKLKKAGWDDSFREKLIFGGCL
ncbi:ISAs1 family transposase [Desulfovibrio sp. OttesenSCG-928-G15]|nr:ISAs1 family transposase [Desulfovibrio sp. OttesenSCG-928-G15]